MTVKIKNVKWILVLGAAILGMLPLAAQQRDTYGNIWGFNVFQHGSFKQHVKDSQLDSTSTYTDFAKLAQPTLEYTISNDIVYANFTAFTGLVSWLTGDNYRARNNPFLEFGMGFGLNPSHPLKILPATDVVFGLGFNLGGIVVKSERKDPFSTLPAINIQGGFVGPVFAANVQVGKRINLHNTAEFSIFGGQGLIGSRIEYTSAIRFMLTQRFGFSVLPTYQKYSIEDGDTPDIRTVTKNRLFQYGINLKFN